MINLLELPRRIRTGLETSRRHSEIEEFCDSFKNSYRYRHKDGVTLNIPPEEWTCETLRCDYPRMYRKPDEVKAGDQLLLALGKGEGIPDFLTEEIQRTMDKVSSKRFLGDISYDYKTEMYKIEYSWNVFVNNGLGGTRKLEHIASYFLYDNDFLRILKGLASGEGVIFDFPGFMVDERFDVKESSGDDIPHNIGYYGAAQRGTLKGRLKLNKGSPSWIDEIKKFKGQLLFTSDAQDNSLCIEDVDLSRDLETGNYRFNPVYDFQKFQNREFLFDWVRGHKHR